MLDVSTTTTTVMLCENRRAVGEAFSAQLNATDHLRCLGIARSYSVARQQLPTADPDAIIVSLGFDAAELRSLAEAADDAPVIFLADPPTAQMTSLAAERENVIVLPAQTPFAELVAAARGERPLSSAGLELAEGQLTEREFQTLCLLVQGLNAKEMAAHLHLSIHTIRFHIKTLLAKLGVGTQTEAILVGIERGFVRPPAVRRS